MRPRAYVRVCAHVCAQSGLTSPGHIKNRGYLDIATRDKVAQEMLQFFHCIFARLVLAR